MEKPNFTEYRKNEADKLMEIRKTSKDDAWNYLEQIRNTEDYKEAERFYRESFALAKLDNTFSENNEVNSTETISIESVINKYNIGHTTEKLDRKTIEEKLNKAETRDEKYKILEEQIGNTPLLELENILPNGNKLFIKLESENALGNSHYMRVYYELIKHYEDLGILKEGQKIYDFTSGSSGIAMAAVGTLLGYKCEVGMPAGGEKAREKAILDWIPEEQLHFSDEKAYVAGARSFNTRFLAMNRDIFFLNHAMSIGPNKEFLVNKISTNACAKAVDEIKRDLPELDNFIAISGNGTTQYGYGHRFKELYPEIEIVGAESFQSAYCFNMLHPGLYEEKYGIPLEDRDKFSRHNLPGTSFPVKSFGAPALEASLPILSEEKLVWDKKAVKEYKEITGREIPSDAIFFDEDIPVELSEFGRTTKVGYKVASKLAENTQNKKYIIFAYDHADRYDTK